MSLQQTENKLVISLKTRELLLSENSHAVWLSLNRFAKKNRFTGVRLLYLEMFRQNMFIRNIR